MKNLLILIALAFSITANAQLVDRFSIGVNTGITFSDYALSRNGNAGSFRGVNFELPVGNFAISSGVEVSNYGNHYNFESMPTGSPEDPGETVFNVTSFNYKYVGIPVRIKYNISNFYAQVGVKSEFFQKQTLGEEGILNDPAYAEKPFYDIEDIQDRNLTAEIALGVNWTPEWTNFSLYLEPTLSYMTKPIFKTAELETNQYSYGLKVGAKYTFKRK